MVLARTLLEVRGQLLAMAPDKKEEVEDDEDDDDDGDDGEDEE